jgi:hypothetical protein
MPKPSKGENKQDFLKRCTAVVMDKEGKEADQAFAICNAAWDDAKSQRAAMILSAPLTLAQPIEGETKTPPFLITAYTGAEVEAWWGRLLIDVGGIKAAAKMPVLREHLRDRVVGYSTKAWKDKQNFMIQGEFSQKTQDGIEVFNLANEGFPWQASIGVWPEKIQILQSDKETAKVNGREVIGPLEIWRETTVREVSFCALGADAEAAAIVLAVDADREKVPVIIERAQIKEAEKIMDITLKLLEEKAPGLLKEIREAAQAEITLEILLAKAPGTAEKLRAEGQQSGIKDERARAVEILEVAGLTGLSLKVIQDGTEPKAAFKLFVSNLDKVRSETKAAMAAAAPPVVGTMAPKVETHTDPERDAPIETRAKAEWDKDAKLQKEFGGLFETYLAYKRNEEKGLIKTKTT